MVLKRFALIIALVLITITHAHAAPAVPFTINAYVDNHNVLVVGVFPPADATASRTVDIRMTLPPNWTISDAHTTAGSIDGYRSTHWVTTVYTTPVVATFQLQSLGATGLGTIWIRSEHIQAHTYVRGADSGRVFFPIVRR